MLDEIIIATQLSIATQRLSQSYSSESGVSMLLRLKHRKQARESSARSYLLGPEPLSNLMQSFTVNL